MPPAAMIEKEIREGFGDDARVPATPDTPPPGRGAAKIAPPIAPGETPPLSTEIASFAPVTLEPVTVPILRPPPPATPDEMLTAAWAWHWFPMGGWVYHNVATRMQREDQGQDFEVPSGHHIIAPSWGKCIRHLSDSPWPNGFGSPYAVVWIGGPCRFQNRFWYCGHDNGSPIIQPGEWFHTGDVLATPNHSFSYGWMWTELGHAPNGYPGPWGEGARWHWAFSPAQKWSAS